MVRDKKVGIENQKPRDLGILRGGKVDAEEALDIRTNEKCGYVYVVIYCLCKFRV